MRSALGFLVAAKRCEIGELEHLALTGSLVKVIGRLIHELQRERGMSNVFLASQATRFVDERTQQCATCRRVEKQVRLSFEKLDVSGNSGPGNGTRLFNRIAYVLHGLDGLPTLRQRIAALAITPSDATAAFIKLIAGLLSVVFEAADSAPDPEISRHLVAMFHFTQGKEFAGQERALGSTLFASGRAELTQQQQWLHLIDSQERCFAVFLEFSAPSVRELWRNCVPSGVLDALEQQRLAGRNTGELDTNLSQQWYQTTTRRIDAMKIVEEAMAAELIKACQRKINAARTELAQQQKLLDALDNADNEAERQSTASFFDDSEIPSAAPPAGSPPIVYGPQLERSILGMVQEQSRRLQTIGNELQAARAALNERKIVERAKGLLMSHRRISEDEAYKLLRQSAMNQNRRLGEVAEAIIATAELLPANQQRRHD